MQYSTTIEYINSAYMLRSMCPGGSKIGFVPTGSTLVTKLQAFLTTNSITNFKDFATETELEEHVRNIDYANMDQICWAIVISQETSGIYNYKLRFNISDGGEMNSGPLTTLPLTSDLSIDLDTYSNTIWGGMVGANHLINDIILGQ